MAISMCGKHASLLIEDNLTAGFKVSLKELTVLLGKYGGHENVDRVTQYLGLVISKYPCQTSTCLQNLADGLFVST
jgi:hypothetical protein